MANRYGLSVVSASVAVTTGGVGLEIAGTGTARAALRQLEVTFAAGVTGVVGIGRPGNTPAGGTSVIPPPTDYSDSASTTITTYAAGWTTAPTVPATFLKRTSIAASLGAGIVWNFEQDKWIFGGSRTNSFVLWIISLSAATATTYNVNIEVAD
jgi:hypothetical protein